MFIIAALDPRRIIGNEVPTVTPVSGEVLARPDSSIARYRRPSLAPELEGAPVSQYAWASKWDRDCRG